MGLWDWLGRREADEWLYKNRAQFAAILGLAIIGQIVALIFGLDAGWHWPAGWLPPVSISDQVEALLATGTLALAFAGLVSAVSSIDTTRASHRPSPVLATLALGAGPPGPTTGPGLEGPRLAIRNLGPGVAKDVKFTWFMFPETVEAKALVRKANLKAPTTGTVGAYRTYLDPDPDEWWDVTIQSPYPAMDYIVEIESRDVFNRDLHTARYRVRDVTSPAARLSGQRVWWIMTPPTVDFGKLPSIQEMIERAKHSAPPFFWDV
ncbi:MAG: hypothetical protein L3J68_00225 [Thermoplasmata archaeon]|nr:hypothetical protein [Thermoplasmata archaeon]